MDTFYNAIATANVTQYLTGGRGPFQPSERRGVQEEHGHELELVGRKISSLGI